MVNGFDHVVRNIQCRQVKQLEGAELEADLVAQDAVDGGEIGNAFAHDAQGFCAITATGVVDDEAWRVLRLHSRVAHLAGKFRQALANSGIGFESGDDLDHFHQGHRVEEVVTRKLSRALQCRCNSGHRQGGCVGDQHRCRGQDFFQVCEQAFLDVELFHNGFDHQFTVSQVLHAGRAQQTAFVSCHGFSSQSAFFLQLVPLLEHGITRFLDGFSLCVIQPDLAARLGCNLGDAPAHGAGANDGHFGECESHFFKS